MWQWIVEMNVAKKRKEGICLKIISFFNLVLTFVSVCTSIDRTSQITAITLLISKRLFQVLAVCFFFFNSIFSYFCSTSSLWQTKISIGFMLNLFFPWYFAYLSKHCSQSEKVTIQCLPYKELYYVKLIFL